MNYVPFVYLLTFKPTGQLYIGSRYAEKEIPPAHPDQLWTSYFTNSNPVKERIEEFGKDAFEYEVRKTFQTSAEARRYENRFLVKVNAAKNPRFLNKHNGGDGFFGGPKSEETRDKISRAHKGKKRGPRSPETIAKVREFHLGRKRTIESKNKMSVSATGRVHAPMSDETKSKISLSHIGRKYPSPTIEQRLKTSEQFKGKPKTDEHRLKMKAAAIRRWANKDLEYSKPLNPLVAAQKISEFFI